MEERKSLFDDHVAFNRWQVMEGMRVNESGTNLSVYITEIKLKKAYKLISDEEIENLVGSELSKPAIKRQREKLEKKLCSLRDWQLFKAFSIYFDDKNIEASAAYVLSCKRMDKKQEN